MSDANPARIVADADVLAADLLVGGAARAALDEIRRHDWLTLVVSDELLAETRDIVAELADEGLAAAWHRKITAETHAVTHPPEDHPALAAAYRGDAAQLLSFDEQLTSAAANRSIQPHLALSVRTPDAFTTVFDPGALYESLHDDSYTGPDREPRS